MTPETIKALLDAFDRSDWREMVVTVGEDRLHVSRDQLTELAAAAPAAPAASPVAATPPPAPPAPPAHAEESPPDAAPTVAPVETLPDGHTAIESPSVGLFWRAPAPGAPPFVEVGQKISAGDTVAIVEVMKLMNHVASPVDGVVTDILVENGGAVEFGQPIVFIDPEE